MPENFLPPNVDNVVIDIVTSFRALVEIARHARQFPMGNYFARTVTIRDDRIADWQRHLAEFDSIIERARDPKPQLTTSGGNADGS